MIYFKVFKSNNSKEWAVFVHGAGGNSNIWFKQIRDFRTYCNLLLLDLRGHGKSNSLFKKYTNKSYSFEDISQDIIEVLQYLRITKAHFIGISMGSIIIRTITEISPEFVKTMVLGGAVIKLNSRSKFLMWIANVAKEMIPLIWIYKLYAFIIMPRKRNKESRCMFVQQAENVAHKEFLRWFKLTYQVNSLLRYFAEKELHIPTLYIMGEKDYMFLPQVQILVKQHKHSHLEILEQCGHVVNIEQPKEFNQISVNFMQRYS